MDRQLLWRFVYAFAWSVKALHLETKDLGWSPEELAWPAEVLGGGMAKIPGDSRIVQDRFVRVFSDFFRGQFEDEEFWAAQKEAKQKIFSSWTDWNAIKK